jgi:hypothetical protein
MPAQGSVATTSGGQTASNSGSAIGQDASPFRTSISMLMALAPARAARALHTRYLDGRLPIAMSPRDVFGVGDPKVGIIEIVIEITDGGRRLAVILANDMVSAIGTRE